MFKYENQAGQELLIDIVNIDLLKPNTWNPKDSYLEDEELKAEYERILQSIDLYGFNDPIDVREVEGGYEICDGEHRWRAGKELGLEKVLIINHGKLSDNEAKAITSLRETIKIPINEVKFAEMIKGMYEENGQDIADLSTIMVMSEDKIKEYIELSDFSWDDFKRTNEEENGEDSGGNDDIDEGFNFQLKLSDYQLKEVLKVLGKVKEKYNLTLEEALFKVVTDYGNKN